MKVWYTVCDQCHGNPPKVRSADYTSFPHCRICGDDICPNHEVMSQRTEEDNRTICKDCAGELK